MDPALRQSLECLVEISADAEMQGKTVSASAGYYTKNLV